jgi:hypothetical protein
MQQLDSLMHQHLIDSIRSGTKYVLNESELVEPLLFDMDLHHFSRL